jgi:hypothetical protein
MTAFHKSMSHYEVKLTKSKALLHEFIDDYNVGRPKREQLRQTHRDLAYRLIQYYCESLKNCQAYYQVLKAGDQLPMLNINNVQLANSLKCSIRTVINLRARLTTAGLIYHYEWHGTNGQYSIMLSPRIIHLEKYGQPANAVAFFALPSAAPSTPPAQTLHHTVTCNSIQVTKELIELGGEPNQQKPAVQDLRGVLGVGFPDLVVEKGSENVGTARFGCGQGTEQDTSETGYETSSDPAGYQQTGYSPPRCAGVPAGRRVRFQDMRERLAVPEGWNAHNALTQPAPAAPEVEPDNTPPTPDSPQQDATDNKKPAARRRSSPPVPKTDNKPAAQRPTLPDQLPEDFTQATAGIEPDQVTRIEGHVNVLYAAAMVHLYWDKWIAETEEARARAALAEYFLASNPERWSDVAGQLLERILLVKRWIKRGELENKNRWVPLPSRYFDVRNEKGFKVTRAWYYQHIKAKQDIKDAELLTKAYNRYLASLKPGAAIGPAETYRRVSQYLGKRNEELLKQFHRKIDEYVNTKSSAKQA